MGSTSDCWIYLTDKGTKTGLITISPFDLTSAQSYVDAFAEAPQSYLAQYKEARDMILEMLGTAFVGDTDTQEKDFLSFIGYPPVLDSIATLMRKEQNYHRLLVELKGQASEDVEIDLLHRIAEYILRREKEQKVVPNILQPLVSEATIALQEQVISEAFENEEQCIRLVCFCLNRNPNLQKITDPAINEKYEEDLLAWFHEHPFLERREFRNPVFESVALATLMASSDSQCVELVLDYVRSHRYSYHLIYLLSVIAEQRYIPIQLLQVVVGSALEFRSRAASVELTVIGPELDEVQGDAGRVETEIEIVMGRDEQPSKTFIFYSILPESYAVELDNRLSNAYVSLPCDVRFSGAEELQLGAPVVVSARGLILQAKALVLRHGLRGEVDDEVSLEAEKMDTTLERIVTNGVTLTFTVSDMAGVAYPAIQYAEQRTALPTDILLREKFIRLKRILVEFRSHNKGALARYKGKIEDERVLRNQLGQAILQRLLADGILVLSGARYFLQTEAMNRNLAISWPDLRKGDLSPELIAYLGSID